jgi:hypothetical protein
MNTKNFKTRFKTSVRNIEKKTIASLIFACVPVYLWYTAAFKITRSLTYSKRLLFKILRPGRKKNFAFTASQGFLLNSVLSILTRRRRPFHIPVRVTGLHLFTGNTHGVVLCSAHMPLTKVAYRPLVENGIKLSAAISGGSPASGNIAIWGKTETIPAIPVGTNVLIKAKNVLCGGGLVTLLIDPYFGAAYSPNMLRLAGKVKARVIFFVTELKSDRYVELTFFNPPCPCCETEAQVQENMQCLYRKVQEILYRQAAAFIKAVVPV